MRRFTYCFPKLLTECLKLLRLLYVLLWGKQYLIKSRDLIPQNMCVGLEVIELVQSALGSAPPAASQCRARISQRTPLLLFPSPPLPHQFAEFVLWKAHLSALLRQLPLLRRTGSKRLPFFLRRLLWLLVVHAWRLSVRMGLHRYCRCLTSRGLSNVRLLTVRLPSLPLRLERLSRADGCARHRGACSRLVSS